MSTEALLQLKVAGAEESTHLAFKLHHLFVHVLGVLASQLSDRDQRKLEPKYTTKFDSMSIAAAGRIQGLARKGK